MDMYMPELLWSLHFIQVQGYKAECIGLYQDNISMHLWLGNPFGILQNSAINPITDLLNSGIFIRILFFSIVKCVPANSEHIFSSSESSPAIYSSNFMN
jgi:hypothetical protein